MTGFELWARRGIVAWWLVEVGGLVVLAVDALALRLHARKTARR